MKNHKQLLMDFYLNLLSDDYMRDKHSYLCMTVRNVLAIELQESPDTVQRIFERMAREDDNSR